MDLTKIVEECLSNIGIKWFQDLNKPKTAIATIKKDLTTLMNTLEGNVCMKRVIIEIDFQYISIFRISFQNSFFIHCIKPNKESLHNNFDENYVSVQLNTIGAAPYVNLMRYGFTTRLPYDMILSKVQPFVSNKAKFYTSDLLRYVLHSIGCSTNGYKLGRTQLFFRPKNEKFANLLLRLGADAAKEIAENVSKQFYIRQRRSLLIAFRFLGLRKSSMQFLQMIPCKDSHSYDCPYLHLNSASWHQKKSWESRRFRTYRRS